MIFRSLSKILKVMYTDVRHPTSFGNSSQFSAVSGSSKLFGPEKMATFYPSTLYFELLKLGRTLEKKRQFNITYYALSETVFCQLISAFCCSLVPSNSCVLYFV